MIQFFFFDFTYFFLSSILSYLLYQLLIISFDFLLFKLFYYSSRDMRMKMFLLIRILIKYYKRKINARLFQYHHLYHFMSTINSSSRCTNKLILIFNIIIQISTIIIMNIRAVLVRNISSIN